MEKMFTLKPGRLPQADVKNVIFFVRPKLELMDIITDNVLRYRRGLSSRRRRGAVRPEGAALFVASGLRHRPCGTAALGA